MQSILRCSERQEIAIERHILTLPMKLIASGHKLIQKPYELRPHADERVAGRGL
jgi:hypothetical protein